MTDPSTSPVPPKEIERHISRLSNLIVGYRTLLTCYRTGNHARADRALTKISAGEGSLSDLYHAIASALSGEREQAARICEEMRPEGGRMWSEGQSACFEALTAAAETIRHPETVHPKNLARIASTEEASQ